jgi:hypothetical protein
MRESKENNKLKKIIKILKNKNKKFIYKKIKNNLNLFTTVKVFIKSINKKYWSSIKTIQTLNFTFNYFKFNQTYHLFLS